MTTTPIPELNEALRKLSSAVEIAASLLRKEKASLLHFVATELEMALADVRASSAQQVDAGSRPGRIGYDAQFQALAVNYANAYATPGATGSTEAYQKLTAFLDTKLRQAATGSADGLDAKRYRVVREIYGNEYRIIPGPLFMASTPEQFDAAADLIAQQGNSK